MKNSLVSIVGIFIFAFTFLQVSQADELEKSINAHGGIDTFRSFSAVEYDQEFALGQRGKLTDNQFIDLNSRNVLITSDSYKIGFDGEEAWIEPNMEAIAAPPRFYASTPFYFFGLPFLFADPGVNAEDLGIKEIDGKQYKAVKFTYDEGVGDTPKDDYVAYFNNQTGQMEIVTYTVTYPPLIKGKSVEELERRAVIYEEWQEIDGLIVPKTLKFHHWTDEKPGAEKGYMQFENVTFTKEIPDPTIFAKPEGAAVDNSHIAK